MTKWEYDSCALLGTGDELDRYGQDGWELVTVLMEGKESYARAYFKRAIPDPMPVMVWTYSEKALEREGRKACITVIGILIIACLLTWGLFSLIH